MKLMMGKLLNRKEGSLFLKKPKENEDTDVVMHEEPEIDTDVIMKPVEEKPKKKKEKALKVIKDVVMKSVEEKHSTKEKIKKLLDSTPIAVDRTPKSSFRTLLQPRKTEMIGPKVPESPSSGPPDEWFDLE